jgi:hypothetical protein
MLTYGLFALSFFFSVQYPSDDGSCELYVTESTCLSTKTALDKSLSKCSWRNVTVETSGAIGYDATCVQSPPVYNAYMNIVMCILVVFATTPILFILEHLFHDVLLAPTATEIDESNGGDKSSIHEHCQEGSGHCAQGKHQHC